MATSSYSDNELDDYSSDGAQGATLLDDAELFGTELDLQPDVSDEEEEFEDEEQLRLDFNHWDGIPHKVQPILAANRDAPLHSEYGLLLYLFGSEAKRAALIMGVVDEIMETINSSKDVTTIAEYLFNYLAAKVRLFVRFPNDPHSSEWNVAQEATQTYTYVDVNEARGLLSSHLYQLLGKIDEQLLIDGNVPSTHRRIDEIKQLLKDRDCDNRDELQSELRWHQKALGFRTIISSPGGKNAIATEYMHRCNDEMHAGRAPVIQGNTEWLPCPDLDVHLEDGMTRRRWLWYNISGTTNVNFTVPLELALKPLDIWTEGERKKYFGPFMHFFTQLSGNNTEVRKRMLISLFMQLLGHNHDKYLHMWTGNGNGGKSLLLSLLCGVMGHLAQPLDKSVIFSSERSQSGHSGLDLQLVGIRSGVIDEVSRNLKLDEQKTKQYISPDVTVTLRGYGERRKKASKSRYPISCALLVAFNKGCFPKFRQDVALTNRFRVVVFPAQFVYHELTEEEKASGLVFPANTDLSEKMKDPRIQEQFLNLVILCGGLYYHENKAKYGEPLPPTDDTIYCPPGPSLPPRDPIKAWFLRRTVKQPGAHVSVAELAHLYCKETGLQVPNPEQYFGQYLRSALPGVEKKQRVVKIDGKAAARMVIVNYVIAPDGQQQPSSSSST